MNPPPRFDILGIGTIAVDDVVHVEHYPPADQKVPVVSSSRRLGGLVGTALAAASRLGARCAYGGVLGDDDLSAAVKRGLAEVGVDGSLLRYDARARPVYAFIVVDDRAHTRTIFYDLAGMVPLPTDSMDAAWVSCARVLLADQFGRDGAIRAAQLAGSLNIPVVADMEWPEVPGTDTLMAAVDHLIVPRDFAVAFTRKEDPQAAVRQLHAVRRRSCTAVTWGDQGCYYLAGDSSRVQRQPVFPVQPVSTIGCGDVFHGAYAAALVEGRRVPECIRFASASAAAYASRPHGWQFLPTSSDLAAVLRSPNANGS